MNVARGLRNTLGIEDPDGFYAKLIGLHEGLTAQQSDAVNAKLILLMANHIGDPEVLDEILALLARPTTSSARPRRDPSRRF